MAALQALAPIRLALKQKPADRSPQLETQDNGHRLHRLQYIHHMFRHQAALVMRSIAHIRYFLGTELSER